jgi:pimeloyl-CoA synthetase
MENTATKKIVRKGAGRTKGSFSFVKIKVSDLVTKFAQMPDLDILVSRKQMEGFGFNDLVTAQVGELKESIAGQSVEAAPEVKSEDF